MSKNDLYAEASRNLREYMGGAEPYYRTVIQYADDPVFRAEINAELIIRRTLKLEHPIKGLWQ